MLPASGKPSWRSATKRRSHALCGSARCAGNIERNVYGYSPPAMVLFADGSAHTVRDPDDPAEAVHKRDDSPDPLSASPPSTGWHTEQACVSEPFAMQLCPERRSRAAARYRVERAAGASRRGALAARRRRRITVHSNCSLGVTRHLPNEQCCEYKARRECCDADYKDYGVGLRCCGGFAGRCGQSSAPRHSPAARCSAGSTRRRPRRPKLPTRRSRGAAPARCLGDGSQGRSARSSRCGG